MKLFALVLQFSSVGAAIASAYLWWYASTIEIRVGNSLADTVHGVFLNDVDVLTTYRVQGKWNKWAALATGLSVFLSSLPQFLV